MKNYHKHQHCHIHSWAICYPCNIRYCIALNCNAEESLSCGQYPKVNPWNPYDPWRNDRIWLAANGHTHK